MISHTGRKPPVVLHVAPHPDDEVMGAGATLLLLRANGWVVQNLACTLGRPGDAARRRSELLEAADRAGFATAFMTPPALLSLADDLDCGAGAVRSAVVDMIDQTGASLVLSPHPHDGHHGHEAVGRGVRDALRVRPAVTWWMWGLWADLPLPTLMAVFDEDTLSANLQAISAYAGENARNGYDALYPARATASSILGSERVFGFGAGRASPLPYAELFTETRYAAGTWPLGNRRLLDPAHALSDDAPSGADLCAWLHQPSLRQQIREGHVRRG